MSCPPPLSLRNVLSGPIFCIFCWIPFVFVNCLYGALRFNVSLTVQYVSTSYNESNKNTGKNMGSYIKRNAQALVTEYIIYQIKTYL